MQLHFSEKMIPRPADEVCRRHFGTALPAIAMTIYAI
jgi:hypothetical protein